jgi:hypothetical protein
MFVMTDTSFWAVERESDEGAAEGDEEGVGILAGVEVGEGDGEVACLRKRTGAATVVNCVVMMTCSTVDVTVEA